MRSGGVDAVHVTIAYHENFRETVLNIEQWNRWFEQYPDLIFHGRFAADVDDAIKTDRTAIFFGFQNPSPIEDDIGLVEIVHTLGARFMQLTYNTGVTRMGKQVIKEMNRVGLVVDMSHSGERSTLEAIELSARPIAITHANPYDWHPALRNKSADVLKALSDSGGILGFSFYPHHLAGKSNCTLESFCEMAARTADLMGIDHIAIGSDLCQDQPDSVVEWMRVGRWSKEIDYGEGSADNAGFPPQPDWFTDNTCFSGLKSGLLAHGFSEADTDKLMGLNWLNFFKDNFTPA